MAVFISGGAGFIGVSLARRFVAEGFDVLAFDAKEPEPEIQQSWPDNVSFERGDVQDEPLIRSLVSRSGTDDPVIHLAGLLTAGCDRNPHAAISINVGGTYNVMEAACNSGGRRTLLASTIGVYGRNLPQPIQEDMATEPDGWYGYTKIAAEQMGLLFARRHGLDFRAVRLAAVTGPFRKAVGSASLFTSLIPEKAALGEPYEIEVTEDSAYPVVYIKDVVDAIVTVATAESAPSRIYNVSSGRVVVSELVEAVTKRIPEAQFSYKPDPVIMQVVSGYKDWRISCARIERELGWKPGYGVEAMVEDIIETVRTTRGR